MTTTTPSVATDRQGEFIENLMGLDRGERARLKRNAGQPLGEARNVMGLFYRMLPYGLPERDHERYFLVATLFPLAPPNNDRNLGHTLKRIRTPSNATGLDRRMATILDADASQLPFRLRQLVRLVDANRGGVNWRQLLSDLLYWDHRERRVQRAWAMDYFSGSESSAAQEGQRMPKDD